MPETQEPATASKEPGLGCLIRLYWMGLGNGLVLFTAIGIVTSHAEWFSVLDFTYWSAVASLLLFRYIDIGFFAGRTSDFAPATLAHWRRYSAILIASTLGIWLLAHGIVHLLASKS